MTSFKFVSVFYDPECVWSVIVNVPCELKKTVYSAMLLYEIVHRSQSVINL